MLYYVTVIYFKDRQIVQCLVSLLFVRHYFPSPLDSLDFDLSSKTNLKYGSILDQVVYPSLFSMSLMLEWVGDDDNTGGSCARKVPRPASPRGVDFPRL